MVLILKLADFANLHFCQQSDYSSIDKGLGVFSIFYVTEYILCIAIIKLTIEGETKST